MTFSTAFAALPASYDLALATPDDAPHIAKLHGDIRLHTDTPYLPDYTHAAAAEGYFDKFWAGYFATPHTHDGVLKAVHLDKAVAFVRFGLIDPPPELAEPGQTGKWGELHQIFILPEHQGQGLGARLFARAAAGLLGWDCRHMLVNVLEDNAHARGFYEHQGGRHRASILEQNRRNGVTYDVPCALYTFDLAPG